MKIITEKKFQNYKNICGVDEVNIMSLAFGVYAAAVVMPRKPRIYNVEDSKKIPRAGREKLALEIMKRSEYFSIGVSTIEEANENIKQAGKIARERAVKKLVMFFEPDIILIDFFKDEYDGIKIPVFGIERGDEISYNIACASILAKYNYDNDIIYYYDKRYPNYDWINNTGCPTKKHIEAIIKYGITPYHRKKWVKNTLKTYYKKKEKNERAI